ncbi:MULTISPECIES: hypothetical protein [unclassified Solwaraspora]|uniref:hypothetical protein n=1 Tax=unclassified Solwaraspora TaxID=2627926 RepID=UPI00248AA4C3|nr:MULTISPECIES: hypothetical protein [unclassified Solwaraspora]WBB94871.1 hypothetical protein O7553_15655 [Solwaraspora sp. WMMA2059]WBC21245.1 hypothetical protein O7543_01715 [Solwaraspora sp. WMMA2080]WJK36673.1 hypothetical protein O7610_10185 [Solwaraspora sp. WMMA2065]
MSHLRAALGVVLAVVAIGAGTLAACTADPPEADTGPPATSGADPVDQRSAAPPPVAPAPTIAPLPGPMADARPVASVAATSGPVSVGTVEVPPGRLSVSLDCVSGGRGDAAAASGAADLAVFLDPEMRFELQCPADEVTMTRNVDQDHPGGPVTIRVEAGADVRWNLLVEHQPG